MVKAPAVSVIMPVYNAESYLQDAIESILNQTFQEFEFLIFDDGSTDRSFEIILGFDDSRIKYFRSESNKGYLVHLNDGLSKARGDYIARMDADDIAFPERLKLQYDFMEKNDHVGLLGTGYNEMGIRSGTKHVLESHDELKVNLLYKNVFCHSTVMFRKSIIDEHHLAYEEAYYTSEDYRLWSRMVQHTTIAGLDIPLLVYRIHDDNISQTKRDVQRSIAKRIQIDNLVQFFNFNSSDEIPELYLKMIWGESIIGNELFDLADFLNKLIIANNGNSCFDNQIFETFIKNKWIEVLKGSDINMSRWMKLLNCPIMRLFSAIEQHNLSYFLFKKKLKKILS